MFKVNKILIKPKFFGQFIRWTHKEKVLYPLDSKRILKVAGKESGGFLQGLITNDMQHLEAGAKSMYTMFLNSKGRVLFDAIIYRWEDRYSYLIECNKSHLGSLQNHLRIYRLRRQIDIADVSPMFKLWALITPVNLAPDHLVYIKNNINIYKDPRLPELGYRVLSTLSIMPEELTETFGDDTIIETSDKGYKLLRYKLGISEGEDLLPAGSCFPLEVNCDYLHGVSFHKGCYIGQELTARVHHTGVVRKRIMPLKFSAQSVGPFDRDAAIIDSKNPKSNIGKLKAYQSLVGLGLMRIKESMDAKSLSIGDQLLQVVKPAWWPIEAPKEKAATPLKTE